MNNIIEYWPVIVAFIAGIVVGVKYIYDFTHKPSEEQLSKVKEWLILICMQAEKELGGGTGALKLRYVYDQFIKQFPDLAKIVSFEFFSGLVDQALAEFKKMMKTNDRVMEYVSSGEPQA